MAIRYVSSSASGSGDGTSPATPWTFAQGHASGASGDTVYVKGDGDYLLSAQLQATNSGVRFVGYSTTPGDNGRFTVKPTGGSWAGGYILRFRAPMAYRNMLLDGTGFNISGIQEWSSGNLLENCRFVAIQGPITGGVSSVRCVRCEFIDCSYTGDQFIYGYECLAKNCPSSGFFAHMKSCFAVSCSGNVYKGGQESTSHSVFYNCGAAYNDFAGGQGAQHHAYDIVWNCTNVQTQQSVSGVYRKVAVPSSLVSSVTSPAIIDLISLTADPFVNSGATINTLADAIAAFALNNAAGGGALLRAAGYPGYSDIGAVQHQDSGTSSSTPTTRAY